MKLKQAMARHPTWGLVAIGLLAVAVLPARADGPAQDAASAALLAKHRAYVGWQFGDGSFASMRITGSLTNEKGEKTQTFVLLSKGLIYHNTYTLLQRAGATVLATASSNERLERLKPLGLDHGINYKTDDVAKSVMQLTHNRGVDLVVDPVGGATLQGSLLSLAYRGRISMVGAAGREAMTVDVSSLMAGNRSLTGVFLGAEIGTDRAHDMIQRLIDEAVRGELKVVIDRTFPLSEAGAAHAYIESRQAVGRVLLIP